MWKEVYTVRSLQCHVKEVHGDKMFPCPESTFFGRYENVCGYQTKPQRLIKRHKPRVHRGVEYSCNYCHYATAFKC
jgi:hypothetical protein